MSKIILTNLLEDVLGKGKLNSNDNVAFYCPFCNHKKKKLEVNLITQHFHCWICNTSGKKIISLFYKLNISRDKISKLISVLEKTSVKLKKTSTKTDVISLPQEFKPLWIIDINSPEYKNAIFYLKTRNVTIKDILKYRIGYCTAGEFKNKIIIPSYDENGSLNYFVARSFYKDDTFKHKNPKVSKDIIGFELHINWNIPIILVEGAFDAIAIKRNAIPLFGKTISNTLKKRIIEKNVKEIYICLDNDAKKQSLETAEYFMSNGIDVYFVDLLEKDPSELGFEKVTKQIEMTDIITTTQLLEYKILCTL